MVHRVVLMPDVDNYDLVHVASAPTRAVFLNSDQSGPDELSFGVGDLSYAHAAGGGQCSGGLEALAVFAGDIFDLGVEPISERGESKGTDDPWDHDKVVALRL